MPEFFIIVANLKCNFHLPASGHMGYDSDDFDSQNNNAKRNG